MPSALAYRLRASRLPNQSMGHTRHPATRPAVRRHRRDRQATTTTVGEAPIAPGGGDQNRGAGRNLPLPHEHDQRTGEVDPQPDDVIRQAKDDIEAGQVDTDMRTTPGLDAARRARLVKGESER
jgi:hypothetical protein